MRADIKQHVQSLGIWNFMLSFSKWFQSQLKILIDWSCCLGSFAIDKKNEDEEDGEEEETPGVRRRGGGAGAGVSSATSAPDGTNF